MKDDFSQFYEQSVSAASNQRTIVKNSVQCYLVLIQQLILLLNNKSNVYNLTSLQHHVDFLQWIVNCLTVLEKRYKEKLQNISAFATQVFNFHLFNIKPVLLVADEYIGTLSDQYPQITLELISVIADLPQTKIVFKDEENTSPLAVILDIYVAKRGPMLETGKSSAFLGMAEPMRESLGEARSLLQQYRSNCRNYFRTIGEQQRQLEQDVNFNQGVQTRNFSRSEAVCLGLMKVIKTSFEKYCAEYVKYKIFSGSTKLKSQLRELFDYVIDWKNQSGLNFDFKISDKFLQLCTTPANIIENLINPLLLKWESERTLADINFGGLGSKFTKKTNILLNELYSYKGKLPSLEEDGKSLSALDFTRSQTHSHLDWDADDSIVSSQASSHQSSVTTFTNENPQPVDPLPSDQDSGIPRFPGAHSGYSVGDWRYVEEYEVENSDMGKTFATLFSLEYCSFEQTGRQYPKISISAEIAKSMRVISTVDVKSMFESMVVNPLISGLRSVFDKEQRQKYAEKLQRNQPKALAIEAWQKLFGSKEQGGYELRYDKPVLVNKGEYASLQTSLNSVSNQLFQASVTEGNTDVDGSHNQSKTLSALQNLLALLKRRPAADMYIWQQYANGFNKENCHASDIVPLVENYISRLTGYGETKFQFASWVYGHMGQVKVPHFINPQQPTINFMQTLAKDVSVTLPEWLKTEYDKIKQQSSR